MAYEKGRFFCFGNGYGDHCPPDCLLPEGRPQGGRFPGDLKLKGSYALGVICERFPDEIVAVRKDSPLVVGVGKNENLIASDIPAILEYTRDVYFLNNGEIAVVKKDEVMLYDEVLNPVNRDVFTVEWDVSQAEKAGLSAFHAQGDRGTARALADTLNPRVKDGEINFDEIGIDDAMLAGIRKITIIACGTAYHASYVGKYIIERFARVPVEVEIASEFRYKNPIIDQDNFVIVVSQSGETADTIAALREAKSRGAFVLAIANVVGSTIAREADKVLYTRAGLEIAVASTKAYTTQLMALYMFALKLAYAKGRDHEGRIPHVCRGTSESSGKCGEGDPKQGVAAKICLRAFHRAQRVLYRPRARLCDGYGRLVETQRDQLYPFRRHMRAESLSTAPSRWWKKERWLSRFSRRAT